MDLSKINELIYEYGAALEMLESSFVPVDEEHETFYLNEMNRLKFLISRLKRIRNVVEQADDLNTKAKYTIRDNDGLLFVMNEFYGDYTIWEDVFLDNALKDIELPVGEIIVLKEIYG